MAPTRKGTVTMTKAMTMIAVVILAVGVNGQSGPVTTATTAGGLGDDYFYEDTGMTSSNNAQTQIIGSGTGNSAGAGSPASTGTNPNTPASTVAQTGVGGQPVQQEKEGEKGGNPDRNKAGQHAGGGLFFPVSGNSGMNTAGPAGGNLNPNVGGAATAVNTGPGPGPISEDYWDGGSPPNMGTVPVPNMGLPRPNMGMIPRMLPDGRLSVGDVSGGVGVGAGPFPWGVPVKIGQPGGTIGRPGVPPWRPMPMPMQGLGVGAGVGVGGMWGEDGPRMAPWGGQGQGLPWGWGGEGRGDSWEFLRRRMRQIKQFGMESELETLQQMYRNINVTEMYYNNDPRIFYGGDDGGMGMFYGRGMGRGMGNFNYNNVPYGGYGEADEGGFWYNGTFYYGGGEREGMEGWYGEDGMEGGYWYNGTWYYSNYYGEDGGMGDMMEDGYWYNGTWYYGTEMDEGGMGGDYYEDGYWYNGTYYYLPDFEDGYWYNGTFHYVPEFDDGYWFNGTFRYLPEYDEGYWYNGTFYYRPEMEMEMEMEMGEGYGGDMMEDGFYYNGTFYPGGEREDGFGYGEREGMEMDEMGGGEEGLMWWQRHHPRWRDPTNDAINPNTVPQIQPGVGMGVGIVGTAGVMGKGAGVGPGWNAYLPGGAKQVPGAPMGPFPAIPQRRLMPPTGFQQPGGPLQQPVPPFSQPFRGYPPFNPAQQQLPRPPISGQVNQGGTQQQNLENGIRITQPSPQQRQQQQQQQQQQQPPPPSNRNPFLRNRQQQQPQALPPNSGYIERNPMRMAMVADQERTRNVKTNNKNANKKDKDSSLLGVLGMGGVSGVSAAGAAARPGSSAARGSSGRRRPPTPYKEGEGQRRGGVRRRRPPPGYRRRYYERMRARGRRPIPPRDRMRRPGRPRPFETRSRSQPRIKPGNTPGSSARGSGVGSLNRGNGNPNPNLNPSSIQNAGGVPFINGKGSNKPVAAAGLSGVGAQQQVVGQTGNKLAGSNGNLGQQQQAANPTVTREKSSSSPLDPYRTSPATALGILFASILGFLLLISPLACLIRKYRQTKKAKKRTFLRRPELGSVDEGIMDAMVRTELGEAGGGAFSGKGVAKKSKRRGNGDDIVKMEEVLNRFSGSSGSTGCWGEKGKGKAKIYKEKRHRADFSSYETANQGAGIGMMTSYDESSPRSHSVSATSSSFSRQHDEMRRTVRGLPKHDEEEEDREREEEKRRRRKKKGLREERSERNTQRRPYTVVGLMSENEDVQIV